MEGRLLSVRSLTVACSELSQPGRGPSFDACIGHRFLFWLRVAPRSPVACSRPVAPVCYFRTIITG